MSSSDPLFTPLPQQVDADSLPERFTFPFYYEPHPLCVQVAHDLQHRLQTQQDWQHAFGVDGDAPDAEGKMFGVLVVQNSAGALGYLSAFSGTLAGRSILPGFVPPVFDMFAPGGMVEQNQQRLAQMDAEVKQRASDPQLTQADAQLKVVQSEAAAAIEAQREMMAINRKARKMQRADMAELSPDAAAELTDRLGQESVIEKLQLRDLKLLWDDRLDTAQQQYDALAQPLAALKAQRKTTSDNMQQALFEQYRFLNACGDEKSLGAIFSVTPRKVPPSGAGDCVAPKLLQYAYLNGYTPVAMAEFWWGISPQSEVRQHGQYYPACQGKCQPILSHMLEGLKVDENPLLENPAEGKTLEILYQDEQMLVVNKPSGFLSVPGKNIQDSVAWRMEQMFPSAAGHLIVHRLDMATSGLMVIALSSRAHKKLQQQFINRTVEKRYEAVLEGELTAQSGDISLPLRGDYDDLPRQLVCHTHGKPAETHWQCIDQCDGRSRVYLYPKTGRTHQLRMHCAHQQGLALPIRGDVLYGQKAERLHLHAGLLELNHPTTGERMRFEAAADF